MGRPKGSKNKPREVITSIQDEGTPYASVTYEDRSGVHTAEFPVQDETPSVSKYAWIGLWVLAILLLAMIVSFFAS